MSPRSSSGIARALGAIMPTASAVRTHNPKTGCRRIAIVMDPPPIGQAPAACEAPPYKKGQGRVSRIVECRLALRRDFDCERSRGGLQVGHSHDPGGTHGDHLSPRPGWMVVEVVGWRGSISRRLDDAAR